MDLTKHCQLCEHQDIDFKIGTLCGITQKKPEFNKRCIKANLDSKLEPTIKTVNIEYQSVLQTKWLVYTNFIVFLLIAVVVVLAGFFLAKYLLQFNVIAATPFIISLVGILMVLPLAIGPLNNYNNELRLAKQKKTDLDTVLNIYNITYDINIKFGKRYHGTQDVNVDLNIKR